MVFHGTRSKYFGIDTLSSASLNAALAEYCALTPACANEAFNAANGDLTSWSRILPAVAAYFSTPVASDAVLSQPGEFPVRSISDLPSPRDPNEHGVFELRLSLEQWAKQEHVRAAWDRLVAREDLDRAVFYEASWGFADGMVSIQHEIVLDMSKARRFGFHATVDSVADFLEVMKTAQELNFLPKY